MQSALVEIAHRIGVLIQLLLIESRESVRARRWSRLSGVVFGFKQARLWRNDSLRGSASHKANQVAAPARSRGSENILARVDIERWPGLFVEWTEPHDLPDLGPQDDQIQLCCPQIVPTASATLECYPNVFAPTAPFPPEPSCREQ